MTIRQKFRTNKNINNNNVLEVGFKAFLEKALNDVEMAECVEEEKVVAIKWPMCEIAPAPKMENLLKSSPDFQFTVAKIVAFGGKCFMYI